MLTHPKIVNVSVQHTPVETFCQIDAVEALRCDSWTVKELLLHVATAKPSFGALIDTGAHVVGMTNYEVSP